jgi:hypothetical protein
VVRKEENLRGLAPGENAEAVVLDLVNKNLGRTSIASKIKMLPA